MRNLERAVLLQIIDERWREHLYDMDYLREGIHLRGFAQRDPLVEYKNEGFALFRDLMNSIWEDFGRYIFHVAGGDRAGRRPAATGTLLVRPSGHRASPIRAAGPSSRPRSTTRRSRAACAVADEGEEFAALPEVETRHVDERDKVGRNDPCWCGSGKKFKKCHGA